jgi:hypothetical protein
LGDFGSRTEAGVYQAPRLQRVKRFGIGSGAFRLSDCPTVMTEAEPGEVLENAVDEFRPAAAGIEILDPEQEFSAAGPGQGMAKRSRIGMSQVEPSGR